MKKEAEIRREVRVQASKTNVRIEIPKIIREMAGIEKGDMFVWSLDVTTGKLTCIPAPKSTGPE